MAYTQTDLDSINAAISSGQKIVRLNNRTIENHSVPQLLAIKEDIKADLASQNSSRSRPPKAVYLNSTKGVW